jgi:hypothetical protein
MIGTQLKHFAKRFCEKLVRPSTALAHDSKFKFRSFQAYLAVAAILALAFSLAAGVGPNPTPPTFSASSVASLLIISTRARVEEIS